MIKVSRKQWGNIVTSTMIVILVVVGIAGTLAFQKTVNNVKAMGVSEYRINECERYTNEDESATWLECDAKRIENNR